MMIVDWKRSHLDSCTSTNDEARRILEERGVTYAVVTAERQDAGRGRLGRSWFSIPGKSLMFSVMFPSPLAPQDAPRLTLLGAAALAHACAQTGGDELEVKWPNDLLKEGKKVAGILTEWVDVPGGNGAVIMGVGINLSIPSDDFPEELRSRATSLEEGEGSENAGTVLLDRFLEVFRAYLERVKLSGEVDLDLWRRWMRPGSKVRFSMGGNIHRGEAMGIRADGALEIQMEDGSSQFVVAGDVTPVTWED